VRAAAGADRRRAWKLAGGPPGPDRRGLTGHGRRGRIVEPPYGNLARGGTTGAACRRVGFNPAGGRCVLLRLPVAGCAGDRSSGAGVCRAPAEEDRTSMTRAVRTLLIGCAALLVSRAQVQQPGRAPDSRIAELSVQLGRTQTSPLYGARGAEYLRLG